MTKSNDAGGAPPFFKTPEELQKAVDEFIQNPPTVTVRSKDEEYEKPLVTISGLCYKLGFASRQSFYDYENRDGFSYTIKRARLYIESVYEGNLTMPNCTGSIFALKNLGWDDKSQVDSISSDGSMSPPQKHVYEIIDPADD